MYRLFIVDDNKYERNGLKNSINWHELDAEVVGVFANGAEALTCIDTLRPHIIITDIAMPVMNGIEMSQAVKETHPEIKIIFISCHSDFEFAKSAVDLGVYGYVLKPVVSDELKTAVKKLLDEFRVRNAQLMEKEKMMKQLEEMLPMVQEQFLKELLLGNFRSREEVKDRIGFLKINIPEECRIYVISIRISEYSEGRHDLGVEDAYLAAYTIKKIANSFSKGYIKVYPIQISVLEFAVVIFDSNKTGNDNERIMNIVVDMNIEISRSMNINAIMGISRCSGRYEEIPALYKQSHKAVNTMFYSGGSPIILFDEINDASISPFEKMPDMETVYQDIKALVSYGDENDIREFAEKYYNPSEFKPEENYIKGFTYSIINITGIILMEAGESFKDIFGDDLLIWNKLARFESILDVKQWVINIFVSVKAYMGEKSLTKNSQIVEGIKNIVKNRYYEQLAVEDISRSVFLSAGYANAIFKKETGMTIFDYLLEYRMEMAKKLLKDPDSKVSSVAEAVSYANKSHFGLLFKKYVGLTPAEYKKKAVL